MILPLDNAVCLFLFISYISTSVSFYLERYLLVRNVLIVVLVYSCSYDARGVFYRCMHSLDARNRFLDVSKHGDGTNSRRRVQ